MEVPNETRTELQPNVTLSRSFKDLLKDNKLGIVDNPLLYREPDDLEDDVRRFHHAHKLSRVVDLDLLLRGARLAQGEYHPGELTAVEKDALGKEENPRLRDLSKGVWVVLLTCCLGAVVQGWSQQSITGPNLVWPYELCCPDGRQDEGCKCSDWIQGAVNGIIYFAASLVGVWLSDPLNEYFSGRRGALFLSGILSFASSIGSGYAPTWKALFACRFVQGIGMGAKAAVVPILESEVSPPKMRGRLLISWQCFTAFGILLGASANLIFNWKWPLQVGSSFIPTVPFLCLVFVCSESPHWLIKHNEYSKAYEVLRNLRDTPLQAARDLYNIHAQIQVETILFSKRPDIEAELQNWATDVYQQELKQTNYARRLLQLFTVERNRRASLAAGIAMACQQLCGINLFAFLATSFSRELLMPQKSSYVNLMPSEQHQLNINSLLVAFAFAAANTISSPIAYRFIDSPGRRFLLLMSLILMIPLLIAMALSVRIGDHDSRLAVVTVFLILYGAAYSPGGGVVPFLYSSEVFPLVIREVGMSFSVSINFLLAGVLATTVIPAIHNSSHNIEKVLYVFAGLDAAAALLVWLLLPGTRQITTLEEMNYIFGVRTRRHVQYQINEVMPWLFRVFIPWLFRRALHWSSREEMPRLPSLYMWNRRRRQQPR